MAISKVRLKAAIVLAMELSRDITKSPDEAREIFAEILSNAIIVEFGNAKATGADSRGDTHNLSIS